MAGANLIMGPEQHLGTMKGGVLSPTSTCHTFDASADGYGRAEAINAVEKVGGKEAVGYVKEEQDEALYKIVKSWPPWFDASRAKGLGLDGDGELVDAVKAFQERLRPSS